MVATWREYSFSHSIALFKCPLLSVSIITGILIVIFVFSMCYGVKSNGADEKYCTTEKTSGGKTCSRTDINTGLESDTSLGSSSFRPFPS